MFRASGAWLGFSGCKRLSSRMATHLGEPRVHYEAPSSVRFFCSRLNMDKKINSSSLNKDESKKSLDTSECTQMVRLCSELHLQCRTYLAIIRTNQTPDSNVSESLDSETNVVIAMKKLHTLLNSGFSGRIKYLYSIASSYDFGSLRANGIRSFVIITMRCCAVLLTHLRQMSSYSLSNWSGVTHRSVISYVNCLMELNVCLELLSYIPRFTDPSCLFPRSEFVDLPEIGHCDTQRVTRSPRNTTENANSTFKSKQYFEDLSEFYRLEAVTDNIKQEYFYGRCLAFYMCPSAQRVLEFLNSLMAGYGNSFLTSKQGIASLVNTVYRSVTSYLSPEDRGKVLAKLTRNSSVQFCKTFWSLAELRVVSEGPNVILPSMAVAHSFKIQPKSLQMPLRTEAQKEDKEFIEIEPPKSHTGIAPLKLRVLCRHLRPGLEWTRGCESPNFLQSPNHKNQGNHNARSNSVPSPTFGLFSPRKSLTPSMNSSSDGRRFSYTNFGVLNTSTKNSSSLKKSSYMLFYIHGGGFIALNSQSQDNFLRVWAEQLDCPILSVDYSLAPEAPYPRALEDCYYAYCWVALNRERLGCTSDACIIIGGDSAGGNLALGVCMRATQENILDNPAGIFLAYTPILVSLTPSPSRLLSLCDPLLPIGVLAKCLLAYAGVDETTLNPQSVSDSNVENSTNEESQENSPANLLWSRLFSTFWFGASKGEDSNNTEPSYLRRSSNVTTSSYPSHFRGQRDCSVPNNLPMFSGHSQSMTPLNEPPTPRKSLKLDEPESPNLNSNQSSFSTMQTTFHCEDNSPEDNLHPSNHSTEMEFSPDNHPRRPPTDLNHVRNIHISQDAYMSPYLASDDMLRRLPPMAIICSQFDPFLDDAIELAKRVSKLNISVDIRVMEDLPHGFLNFCLLGPEFQKANKICLQMVSKLLDGCYKSESSTTDNSQDAY